MGITGLIPFLEKATKKVTLKELRGSTVGIDTYCWLHKGAISCAEKLIRGDPTDLHIKYCLKYVNLLLSHNIKPVLVFDGRHLPAKALTEKRRNTSRKDAKERAKELLREGNVNEARTYINRAVNITHAMAHQLIVECRKRNVDCIVAPYEADGQLGYLSRKKIIDYVITEDSDLTLFGCPKVIFKFDLTGQGLLFEAEHLYKVLGVREDRFTYDELLLKFQMMCILSGCDYLDSLKGVGLAKACKFVLMTEETDLRRCLGKVPQYLNLKGITVDDEYKEGFIRSLATFQHMIVYDPKERKQCHLTEPEEKDLPFCDNAGEKLDDETAFQLAIGNMNPFTLKQLDCWDPSELNTVKYPSIWGSHGGGGAMKGKSGNVIITVPKKATPTKRKVEKPKDLSDDEDETARNTSFDIMNMYLEQEATKPGEDVLDSSVILTPPEPKKIRLSMTLGGDRGSKNPFLKKKEVGEDTEKAEGEKTLHKSLLQQANAIKTEKAPSKFKKTKIEDRKVSIVSRFFSGAATTTKLNEEKKEEPVKKEKELEVPEKEDEIIKLDENANETNILLKDTPGTSKDLTEEVKESEDPMIIEDDPPESSQNDSDSEPPEALSFVQVQYSQSEETDSDMQRENEASPVPWMCSQSSLSDKENDQEKVNKTTEEENIPIEIPDDDTPQKSPLVRKFVKSPKRKGSSSGGRSSQQPKSKTTKGQKQVMLTSFFRKK